MIGDETKRFFVRVTLAFVVLTVLVGVGLWFLRGRGEKVAPPLVAAATPTQSMIDPTEPADVQPRIIVVTTASEPRTVDDFGFPPGYVLPAGAQAGAEEIPDLKRITPAPPATETPRPQQPSSEGGQPVDIGRLVEGAKKAGEQAKAITEPLTGPTPTPTPRGGILNTGVAAGVPGWVWIGVFILVAIVALVATGFVGIERE